MLAVDEAQALWTPIICLAVLILVSIFSFRFGCRMAKVKRPGIWLTGAMVALLWLVFGSIGYGVYTVADMLTKAGKREMTAGSFDFTALGATLFLGSLACMGLLQVLLRATPKQAAIVYAIAALPGVGLLGCFAAFAFLLQMIFGNW